MAPSECVDHIDDDDRVDEHCNVSFNCLSCANMVVTEVVILLLDDEARMLVILRMNVHFMECMKEHYGHAVGNQPWKMTVID